MRGRFKSNLTVSQQKENEYKTIKFVDLKIIKQTLLFLVRLVRFSLKTKYKVIVIGSYSQVLRRYLKYIGAEFILRVDSQNHVSNYIEKIRSHIKQPKNILLTPRDPALIIVPINIYGDSVRLSKYLATGILMSLILVITDFQLQQQRVCINKSTKKIAYYAADFYLLRIIIIDGGLNDTFLTDKTMPPVFLFCGNLLIQLFILLIGKLKLSSIRRLRGISK